MSGKFCAVCLEKDVRRMSLHRLADCWHKWLLYLCYRDNCGRDPYFPIAFAGILAHNYKDIHGHRFTPACTPSASLERTGRQPSSSRGCNRSSLSRKRILRSERFGASQIRDAAQRPEGRPCGGGGGPSLWSIPAGLLCHSSIVPARRPAGITATQARAETTPQAQRRSDGRPHRGYTRSWTNPQGRRVGGALVPAVWRRDASAQYPAAAAPLPASKKKRR